MNDDKYERCALQFATEMEEFLSLIKDNGITSYLEIGSKFGGSLWRIANVLPGGSRVAAIDLPQGDKSMKTTEPHLVACVGRLKAAGYDAHLHLGDSATKSAFNFAASLGPFDLVFIDGNHSREYAIGDYQRYGPMARKLVAMHDINFSRPTMDYGKSFKVYPYEVPAVWNEIKQGRRFHEIKYDKQDNGIGILWQ